MEGCDQRIMHYACVRGSLATALPPQKVHHSKLHAGHLVFLQAGHQDSGWHEEYEAGEAESCVWDTLSPADVPIRSP